MFEKWLDDLITDLKGKIWWDNFQSDLAYNSLRPEVEQQFRKAVETYLKAAARNSHPLDTLVMVIQQAAGAFDMQGQRVPNHEPFSRLIDYNSFARYHIDYLRLGLDDSETLKDKIWKKFKRSKILPRHFKGTMRTSRNFFWGTPTRCLDKMALDPELPGTAEALSEKDDLLATELRNLLGLSYQNEGMAFYRIDIPLDRIRQTRICAPTALDSSPYCVFLSAGRRTRFGWTFHLRTLKKGVEEVIIQQLELTPDCTVTQVGYIRGPLPDDQGVWAALERQITARRQRQKSKKTDEQSGRATAS